MTQNLASPRQRARPATTTAGWGEAARLARDRAIDLAEQLAQTRFLLIEQAGRAIPMPFLVVLVFWLMAIAASLTLLRRETARWW